MVRTAWPDSAVGLSLTIVQRQPTKGPVGFDARLSHMRRAAALQWSGKVGGEDSVVSQVAVVVGVEVRLPAKELRQLLPGFHGDDAALRVPAGSPETLLGAAIPGWLISVAL